MKGQRLNLATIIATVDDVFIQFFFYILIYFNFMKCCWDTICHLKSPLDPYVQGVS